MKHLRGLPDWTEENREREQAAADTFITVLENDELWALDGCACHSGWSLARGAAGQYLTEVHSILRPEAVWQLWKLYLNQFRNERLAR
jgi:hypothetical protein